MMLLLKDGDYALTTPKVVGVFIGLLVFHGMLVTNLHAPFYKQALNDSQNL